MKTTKLAALLCLLLFLSSCMDSYQLENLGIILTRGVDVTDDEEVHVTINVLQFMKDAPSVSKTLTGKAKTIKGAVKDVNSKTNQEVVPGKLELEIYGKEAAEKGISTLIDTLRRDANIPNTMQLAVSETKANDIFNVKEESIDTNLGEFLHGIIMPSEEKRLFPEAPLPKVIANIHTPGIEPVLPILGMREGVPTLTGIAIFKQEKMVGSLPIKDQVLIKIIEGTLREEMFEVQLPMEPISPYLTHKKEADKQKHVNMVFLVEKGTGNHKLKDKTSLKYDTIINMDLNLLETSESLRLDDPKVIHQIEKEVEKVIKNRYKKILTQLQELNADIFGYGVTYRINKKGGKLSTKEWNNLFPTIDVNYDVKVKIIRHGEVHR